MTLCGSMAIEDIIRYLRWIHIKVGGPLIRCNWWCPYKVTMWRHSRRKGKCHGMFMTMTGVGVKQLLAKQCQRLPVHGPPEATKGDEETLCQVP